MIKENLFIKSDSLKSILKKYNFSDTIKGIKYQYQVCSRGMTIGEIAP